MAAKKPTPLDFERSLAELEQLVEQMEKGDLTLEGALLCFERGVELSRLCQSTLRLAEQKVETLLAKDNHAEIVPFEPED